MDKIIEQLVAHYLMMIKESSKNSLDDPKGTLGKRGIDSDIEKIQEIIDGVKDKIDLDTIF